MRNLSALVIVLLLAFGLAACQPQTEEDDQAAVQAEAWAALQQAKTDIDAKRQELSELLAAGAPEGEAAAEEGAGEEGPQESGSEVKCPCHASGFVLEPASGSSTIDLQSVGRPTRSISATKRGSER